MGDSANGKEGLDTTYPYEPAPYDSYPGGYPLGATNHTEGDKPQVPFGHLGGTAIDISNESFRLWIMFLPPGEESRYVPTKMLSWNYSVSAALNGTTGLWAVVGTPSQSVTPATITYDHPIWVYNAGNNTPWVNLP